MTMQKKDSYITGAVIALLALIAVNIVISYDQFNIGQIKNNWQLYLTIILVITFFINLTLSHRHLSEKKEISYVNNFFQFPVNLCVSLLTFIAIIDVIYQVDSSSNLKEKKLTKILANYGDRTIIENIEKNAIEYKKISSMYGKILKDDSLDSGDKEELWEKKFPDIPYIKYQENEIQWHYSNIFIQQMISIINVFDMKKILPLSDNKVSSASELEEIEKRKRILRGWMACFKLFLKNPTVRNAWENTKSAYANPDTIAWVQQYIIDDLKNNPDYFKEHKKSWDAEVDEILKKKSPEH